MTPTPHGAPPPAAPTPPAESWIPPDTPPADSWIPPDTPPADSGVVHETSPGPAAPTERPPRRRRRGTAGPGRRLPELVFAGADRYRLVRAWPRGRDHALVELATDGGTTVAAQWFADPAALAEAAAKAPAPARAAGDVLLQPDGADARLGALRDVLAADGTRLVAHRPGRRAVVAVAGDGGVREYVKVVRPSKAADLAARGGLVGELVGDVVPVPRLIDESQVARGVLRWSVLPGRTLHDLGAAGGWSAADARAAWEAAGRAVARLHSAPAEAVAARHGVEQELDALASWLDPAVAHGLLDADLVARAGERVTAALAHVPADPVLGVLHRDLHDKQLLLDDAGTVGMIDVDTLAVGERALDVANLLVHLELRQAQGLLTEELAAAARDGFLAGLGAQEVPVERVEAYTRATRLRLAGVYAFRPRWRQVATGLLHRAARA